MFTVHRRECAEDADYAQIVTIGAYLPRMPLEARFHRWVLWVRDNIRFVWLKRE